MFLEICVVILSMDENGDLYLVSIIYFYVEFFEGVNFEKVVLEFIGIYDLFSLLWGVVSEDYVLKEIYKLVCKE